MLGHERLISMHSGFATLRCAAVIRAKHSATAVALPVTEMMEGFVAA